VTLARQGRELLYGRNAVLEALRGRRRLERLFVAEGVHDDERLRALVALARERGVTVDQVPRPLLSDATRGANHQGVALEAELFPLVELEEILDGEGTILVLDHLQDPQNMGTLLRAAEAAAVAGIVIPENRSASISPAVVNASAGAVEHLRVAVVTNLARALEAIKRSGRWVVGLDAGPAAQNIYQSDVPQPVALVVGAEGAGLSSLIRSQCDLLLALPMRGRVSSLNAATAGAIALYELMRRDESQPAADEEARLAVEEPA
jgi:23S rRNA (guanosine2251-2'-O)-methyltransferase